MLTAATISCSNHGSMPEITHLPFKVSMSDDYGLIGTDGKVLFEDEFEGSPSAAAGGIFYVNNPDGTIEYYTADKQPKSLNGKTYVAGGFCTEGLIPVVREGENIAFLKKNGDVAFVLKECDGEQVVAVNSYFSDGLCLFKTANNRYGYIDTKGRVAIKPQYMFAAPFSEGIAVVSDESKKVFGGDFNIIDTKGKKIAKLNADMTADRLYMESCPMYSGGLLYFGGKVFDRKGEPAFRLSDRIEHVFPYCNGYAVFEDKDGCYGLLDDKGEIAVRAKYTFPGHIVKDRVFFYNDDESTECIDFKGERIFKSEYPVLPVSDNRCIARTEKEVYFVDFDGEAINKDDFSEIEYPDASFAPNLFLSYMGLEGNHYVQWVHSDEYAASTHVASVLNVLNETGVGCIEMGMPVTELKNHYKMGDASKHAYSFWNEFEGVKGTGNLSTFYRVQFSEYIADYSEYNRYAEVNHIIIEIEYGDVSISNAQKRIRNAVLAYLERIGFRYFVHNDDWHSEAWDIYISDRHDYSIAVSENGLKLVLEED